ncbi:MAG: biotin--[acetyl-CoA-carboxylase] ligase [Rhodobacteraceae bacterium]|nr:biotin--[acetyl-CoA-carboxylase] ligase [Paracoccaceae bacterium]
MGPEITGPIWILGLRQTAGRGRRGRNWLSAEGNFTATLAMRVSGGPAAAAQRSFVAALALRDALADATRRPEAITLKWPNDVLLNGAKVAGILLEATGQGAQLSPLCVGIGVNLVASPDVEALEQGAMAPTSVLSATGIRLTPEEFLDLLAPAFAAWDARLTTFGFDPLRRAFLNHAAKRGEVITARTARDSITGTFTDIDADGALVLTGPKGRVTLPAAEIYF